MSAGLTTTAGILHALAKSPPKDDLARQELYDAARSLMYATESLIDTEHRLVFGGPQFDVVRTVSDLGVFEILVKDSARGWTVDELASKCGADVLLLHRLLRYLSAAGLIKEPAEATYQASNPTTYFTTSSFKAALKHHGSFTIPPFQALPAFLAETQYRNPLDVTNTAFQKGLNTDFSIMEYLGANPDKAAYTFEYMAAHKAAAPTWMDGSVPVEDFKISDEDRQKGRAVLVDVGGGSGHQCIDFRKAFPDIKGKLVVQDIGVMIDMVDKKNAEAIDLEPMAHDFFTPQPIKGAKVYYLRTVLHDWTPDKCKIILGHLKDAMAPDSVVIIDEIVLPETGATLKQMHYDLTMMAVAGAMERTRRQWQDMLAAVGLKIRDVWVYDKTGTDASLIVAVPE